MLESPRDGWRWVFTRRAWFFIWFPVLLVSVAHYSTAATHHWLHDIFRKLYYIPIVLGAFAYGLRGSLSASVLATLLYLPHAFTHLFHMDPARSVEKLLEVLLYNVVAIITGSLAQRERGERLRQERIAAQLAETLEEKKLLEEQLVRAGRLQALGELTAGLAHEIKNPLASIKGAAEIIADEVPHESPRRKMVKIQEQELERLQTVLDKFLSFARPAPVEAGTVALAEVIAYVVELAKTQADKSGVSLSAPASAAGLSVNGDGEQIKQVLLNLVLNSLDATPAGGRVELSCDEVERARKRYCTVTVADTGQGIPSEHREKVFNPFFTTKESGAGLGLSIAARIVDQHNGFIELSEGTGQGTRVTVFLPSAAATGKTK